jgi:tetratricopeptide (TPR) repeat protein
MDEFAPLSAWSAKQAAGALFEEGGSQEELDKAWGDVQRRLEQSGDMKYYAYQSNNPYLQQSNTVTTTAETAATTTTQAHTIENTEYDSELLQRGKEAFEKGQLTQAIQIFEAIVQQSNYEVDHSEAWYYLGQCHSENDDEVQAIQAYEHAQELDPYHLDTLLALSICYVNELHSVKALETLQQWIQQNPKFVGLNIQPDAYSDGTMVDEVQHFLLSSLQYAPQDVELRMLLGIVSHLSMEYDSAEHYFRHVLTQKPNDYSILNKVRGEISVEL